MVKVELHTHTKYSNDCTHSFADIIDMCLKKKIDVVGITDHNEIEGAFRLSQMAPFRVIIGEEILTKDGEIIGLFLKKFIPPGLSMRETIKIIRRQGGLTYLPHPYDTITRQTGVYVSKIGDIIDQIDTETPTNKKRFLNQ